MVPMIVVAGVIIGMITIVPSAMADHKDGSDDGKDWKICKKSFEKAFKDFRKHGFITPERRTLVNQCLSEGFQSPWNLPKDELDDNRSPALSGLSVEFVTIESDIPNGSGIFDKKLHPCPSGKIIIDEPLLEIDVNAQVSVEIMTDRTTLMISSFNMDIPGTAVIVTPCLGVIGN